MKRRNVLKKLGAATAVGTGLSAPAAAASPDEEQASHVSLQAQYDSLDSVRDGFEAHGSDLLARLDDEGLLSSTDLDDLDAIDAAGADLTDADDIDVMSTVDDQTDTETAVVKVTESVDDGELALFVLPEAGRSYATIDYEDGDKRLMYGRDPSVNSPTDAHEHGDWQFQYTTTNCTDSSCDAGANCVDSIIGSCGWTYYTEEVYEVYECGRGDILPDGSLSDCGVTKHEIANTNCSSNCCSHSGPGCGIGCGQC